MRQTIDIGHSLWLTIGPGRHWVHLEDGETAFALDTDSLLALAAAIPPAIAYLTEGARQPETTTAPTDPA